mmetsp:Transcript_52954/g.123749  ORF Transcript_52954/g.123749 Transcript_52954/m.123749 type:complete len:203 (-) Transcript_52954:57-665(-)
MSSYGHAGGYSGRFSPGGSASRRSGGLDSPGGRSESPQGNIRHAALGRLANRSVLTSCCLYTAIPEGKYSEVCDALMGSKRVSQRGRATLKVDDRGSCTTCRCGCEPLRQTGAMHYVTTDGGWVFIVMTAPGYNQSKAYRMLEEFQVTFERQEGIHAAPVSRDSARLMVGRVQQWLPRLCQRYDRADASISGLTHQFQDLGS